MNCREFEDKIPEYLEGILDERLEKLMDEHRITCAGCARAVKIHEYVLATLDNTEPVKAPAGLAEKILAAAEAEKAPAPVKQFPGYREYFLGAAALVAAAFGIFNLIGYILGTPGVKTASERFTVGWGNIPDFSTTLQGWMSGIQAAFWQVASYKGFYSLYTPVQIPYFSHEVSVFYLGVYAAILIIPTLAAWMYVRNYLAAGMVSR
jgi:hypothetical protein